MKKSKMAIKKPSENSLNADLRRRSKDILGVSENSIETGEGAAAGFSSGRQTQISDELAIKTFQFLLDTQYIGKSSPEKRRAVSNIKSILTEWLEK